MRNLYIAICMTGLLLGGCASTQQHNEVALNQNENSFQILNQLAKDGNVNAQFDLAMAYDTGNGATLDYENAASWYLRAAEQGHTAAQAMLGGMYVVGRGVQQDDELGRLWSERAAREGDHTALFVLGVIYESGLGVVPDYVNAYAYLSLSELNGYSSVGERISELEKKMSVEEISLAQAKARRCVISNYKDCI